MSKYVLIFFVVTAGCSVRNDADVSSVITDSLTVENRALIFFRDSLLDKTGLFGETEGKYRDIPFMDSSKLSMGFLKKSRFIIH